jgi:hypothetical protein
MDSTDKEPKKNKKKGADKGGKGGSGSGGSPIYGLGVFGAWLYFFQFANEPEEYALAVLKGLFWPAFMVYEAFTALALWKGQD